MPEHYGRSMLKHTPLHSRHVDAGAKTADFGGWEMPIEYTGTVAEHTAVREAVGVFDVSHMGKVAVFGPGAAAFVNSLVANDLDRISDGQAQYSIKPLLLPRQEPPTFRPSLVVWTTSPPTAWTSSSPFV